MSDPESGTQEDFWIFRDGRNSVPGHILLRDLQLSLRSVIGNPRDQNCILKALIQSGEIESALADVDHSAAPTIADLTSALADLYLGGNAAGLRELSASLDSLTVPSVLATSPPEGFAYYALHPLDFAAVAEQIANASCSTAVIGVRSIGTTLSAVVVAALKKKSVRAQRITVRPTGHPYDRTAEFTADQTCWINQWREQSSTFLVVDEGPGRSGSTFLSVAEALVQAGVPATQITLIGSVEPDLSQLRARNVAARWQMFRFLKCNPTSYARFNDHIYIGGGEWRGKLLHDLREWPACWPQMERLKFLAPDGTKFFKFEGLGRFGELVQQRALSLAEAGFGCPMTDAGDGFALYTTVALRSPKPGNVSDEIVERIARYCAFRAVEFRVENCLSAPLAEMLQFNVQQEFGIELKVDSELLASSHLVLADARIQPHEWIQKDDGTLIKTDGATHGDDHFFPGPCDIAWDLAGTAVEWNLHPDAFALLLLRFREMSGIDVSRRIRIYIFAYAVFRMAFCKMASGTLRGTADEFRLRAAYFYYRRRAQEHLSSKAGSQYWINLCARSV